jgi:16S rRNA (uracil1498-N3)-methyltransferase
MARRRFFVPQIRRDAAELTGDEAEHLVRVLRAEAGQVYEISDNERLYLAEIEVARKSQVTFKVLKPLPMPAPEIEILLLAALIKFDRFEWIVEKATELGVNEIRPFEATRSERGLAKAAVKRIQRWEKIAHEASEQARRARLPLIADTMSFREALGVEANVKLIFDEDGNTAILKCLPETRVDADRVALLVGPEGGWTEEERAGAHQAGWQSCSLGATVLRSETAAAAGIAVVRAAWSGRSFY